MSASENMKKRWADPLQRAVLLECRRTSMAYQNRGEKISARAKERWATPEFKAKMALRMKDVFKGRVGSPHSTPVTVAGVQYPSIAEAVRQTGFTRYEVNRLRQKEAV